MTIPFGRRRLILTVAIAPASSRRWDGAAALGATDAELASFARNRAGDVDRVHWEGLRLMYGGARRS